MTSPFTTTVSKVQRHWHLFLLFVIIITYSYRVEAEDNRTVTNVGAIISVNSRIGRQQKTAMEIAAENFNNHSKNHKIVLHFQDSNGDPLLAASSAQELIKEKKVDLLMGMETWQEAALVAEVGNKAQVPVISFAAPTMTTPHMHSRWPFLIRTARNASAQIACIAGIVAAYNWKRVVVIYEDDGYGGDVGTLALLSGAIQDVGSKIEHQLVLPQVSSGNNPNWVELEEMLKLPTFQTRVFIVLKSSLPTVTNLFRVAKTMGLVGRDSAWIITESITDLLDPQVNPDLSDMEGILGIKTYYATNTSSYAKFNKTFGKKYQDKDNSSAGIQALRAYDLTRIVTQAIRMPNNSTTNIQLVLDTVLRNYPALSGRMHIEGGEVVYSSPIFTIINVVEGNRYKELNFWRPEIGFSERLTSKNRSDDVGRVAWPGNLSERAPKGWAMPTADKPMRIVVPGRASFGAFVKVDLRKNTRHYEGFCIDIFHKVRERLEYPLLYEFQDFNGSYNDLVEQVYNKTFDAGIGDITILPERLDKVEYTQPYMESGLSMIVPEKSEQLAWLFMKPFTWKMWVLTCAILVYTILIVWFLERLSNPEFNGTFRHQIGTATWFTFTSLFFSHREKITNNLTRVVVIVWLFFVLIVTSSYTANLSSMLTIQRLKPNMTDLEMLNRTNSKVGVDGDSFVKGYMLDVLHFNRSNLIKVTSEFDYPEAFKNRSISAACLELPYAKVFMNHYCKGYTASTPTYKFGGLGFVSGDYSVTTVLYEIFQKGSPIARDFTKAILELLEDGELKLLEDTWLTPNRDCPNNATSSEPESLNVKNFGGLYVITTATSTICFVASLAILLKKFRQHHDQAYQGNASDRSVWSTIVRMARFIYNRDDHIPSRESSFTDVVEMTSVR